MTKHSKRHSSNSKEIHAWGIRRREVDIHQLALAYYLLARQRIEQRRQETGPTNKVGQDESA